MTNDEKQDIADFKDFLDELTAGDFDRSSAINISNVGFSGERGFRAFMAENLDAAEQAFLDAEGEVDPIITLANADEERAFEGYHDETVRDMFDRIKREVEQMDANMAFVAMILHASTRLLDINGLDGDEIQTAIDRGDLKVYYGWYAEHRKPGAEPDRRCGLWEIHGDELGERNDGDPANAPLFHSLLER